MQQKSKPTGIRKMIKLFPTLLLTLFSWSAFAQDSRSEFQMNFIKTVHYPDQLKNSCTPAFANLLVDISETGIIKNLFISDSAPKLLKDEFENAKKKLDIQLLEKIIIKRKLKNCGIIVPLFYVYGQDYCTNSFADFLSKGYLTFESKTYDKPTFSIEPIVVSFYKPVQ